MMESNFINEQTETMKTQVISSNKYIGKEHFFFKKFHHIRDNQASFLFPENAC